MEKIEKMGEIGKRKITKRLKVRNRILWLRYYGKNMGKWEKRKYKRLKVRNRLIR